VISYQSLFCAGFIGFAGIAIGFSIHLSGCSLPNHSQKNNVPIAASVKTDSQKPQPLRLPIRNF
jgi:hypothetical protein